MKKTEPFFSVGVTAYERPEMLKECLLSVLRQDFQNFEILVGNDSLAAKVTGATTGLDDKRIIFINNEQNLGEIANMNMLLSRASGCYFMWLADDDLLLPGCLDRLAETIRSCSQPDVVYPLFAAGAEPLGLVRQPVNTTPAELTGAEWVGRYLQRKFRVAGCYGAFKTSVIRGWGGMTRLGSGFSPYSDNLLALKAGLLQQVVFLPEELFFFRTHDKSLSNSSGAVQVYVDAQNELLQHAREILRRPSLVPFFATNYAALLRWCIRDYRSIVRRSETVSSGVELSYGKWVVKNAQYCGARGPGVIMYYLAGLQPERIKSFREKISSLKGNFSSLAGSCMEKRGVDEETLKACALYEQGGRLPWSPGYKHYKAEFIKKVLTDETLMKAFDYGAALPERYGRRLDERVVELPWVMRRLTQRNARLLLDAGSAMNQDYLLDDPAISAARIIINTLAPEAVHTRRHVSYLYGDLRDTVFKSNCFDVITCVSTLEHVGMDNTQHYTSDKSFAESKPDDYRLVMRELTRVLKPDGVILLTVPVGRTENLCWLQQFSPAMLDELVDTLDCRLIEQTYYRYTADGWQTANAEECVDCRYFDINAGVPFDQDYAAAARAVCCLMLEKSGA